MVFFWVRHFHPGGLSFPPQPRLTGLEWRAFFINNSKTIKGIRLIFSGLIDVHKVYLHCKEWLSSNCSFCVILNSTKVHHFCPGQRYRICRVTGCTEGNLWPWSSFYNIWKIEKKLGEMGGGGAMRPNRILKRGLNQWGRTKVDLML